MKRALIILSVVCFTTTFSLNAQHISDLDWLLYGGITYPQEPVDWEQNWKWGFSGGSGVSYRLSPHFAIDGNLDLFSFGFDQFAYGERNPPPMEGARFIDGHTSYMGALTGSIKYYVLPRAKDVTPYILAGAGPYYFYRDDMVVTVEEIDGTILEQEFFLEGTSHIGIVLQGAAGFELTSTENRSYFLEIRYGVGLSGDDTMQYMPIRLGFRQTIF